MKWVFGGSVVVCALGLCGIAAAGPSVPAGTIPVTTSSEEARELYLQGRDLVEKLRATDARKLFEAAAAKDKGFALAQLGLANSSQTAKEFFAAIGQAVALADKVSEPERLLILGTDAGGKGDVAKQKQLFTHLTELVPNDARAHNLLGTYYFGRQEYEAAVAEYRKSTAIDPGFSQPYNQLGYAQRFLGHYPEAELAFKKYVELIPGDPNPYDSYAELLMKMGRFDDSIQKYRQALAIDANFVASYVGIGNDQMFQGQGADARSTFATLLSKARNSGEKRQAYFWTAMSYVHEAATDKAVAEVQKMQALDQTDGDLAGESADLNTIANIQLEAGQPDRAKLGFAQQLATIDKASVPAEVKEAAHRNGLFDEARVALAKGDIQAAKALAASYGQRVAVKQIPFEERQQHELLGRIHLAEKDGAQAVVELQQANNQDPRALYLLAVALQAKGEAQKARETCSQAADFNGLSGNYGFVRTKAKELLAKS
jgi:tetratricopeptide (TPR) repeat protein